MHDAVPQGFTLTLSQKRKEKTSNFLEVWCSAFVEIMHKHDCIISLLFTYKVCTYFLQCGHLLI